MRNLLVLLLAALLPLACSFVGSDGTLVGTPGGLLETDQVSYDAQLITEGPDRVLLDIPFQTYNPTDEPLYVFGCRTPSPPLLEKRVDGVWQTAYAAVVTLCLSPPFEIAPGEVRHDTLRVEGYLPGQKAAPTFDTKIEGTYRLRWEIYDSLTEGSSPRGRDLLPLTQRVSNTFQVR